MYLSYYGLEFNPFTKEIDTKYAYETEEFKIIQNRLEFIKENKGIALITGTSGLGKTFAIRKFLLSLNSNLYKSVYICMTSLTVYEFYKQLCYELDIEPPFKKIDMFKAIQERITSLVNDRKINIIIVIDEAQYLKPTILSDIKLLFNFEMDSRNYATVILVGQPVLNSMLNRNIHEALKQRITVSYNMMGITKEELNDYINNRIDIAHGNKGIFSTQAIEAIFSVCGGSLRVANDIIIKSLIIGYHQNKQVIDSDIVLEACNEISLG